MRTANSHSQSTIGPQRWTVPSSKYHENGVTYTVTARVDGGEYECTCPARRTCWHIKAVASGVVGRPRVRYMPAAPVRSRAVTDLPVDSLYGDGGVGAAAAVAGFRRTRGGDVLAESWGRAVAS